MRVRTYNEIRKGVIEAFQRDYPGETIHSDAFSIYILDIYCKLIEDYELYRYMIRTGNDL
jgi:hypothetical protein